MSKLKAGSTIGPFPYRIVKQLGAGSGNMADVYLATVGAPEMTTSLVVIKISKAQDEHREFFEDTIFNESERLRKLDHRGTPRILPIQTTNKMRVQPYAARASNLTDNPWFLVLEYLVGGSLADVLQEHKQLDIGLAIEITRKIAQTLEYLHANDLVHLDLKPENILFRRPLAAGGNVEPVVIDFGIARNTGQEGLEGRSLLYAPPERVLNNRGNAPPETLPRPSPAMDIYSLGVVFYQMLAGRRPFEGRTQRSISSAILEGKPTRPSKSSHLIWKELDDLVMEMLNRDPIQRPTAGELVERLAALSSQPAYSGPPSTSGQSVQIAAISPRRRFALLRKSLAVLTLLLILIGGGEAYAYFQNGALWLPTQTELQAAPTTLVELALGGLRGLVGNSPNPPSPVADLPLVTPTVALLPTATAISAPIIIAATATSVSTEEVATSSPTATATPTQTPTRTVTPKPKVPTSTPVAAIVLPTSTAIPPTPTKAVTATPMPVHTATKTPLPPTPRPVAPPPIQRTVTLLSPPSKIRGTGKDTFSWQANFALEKGQAFELIFWRNGEDPFVSGKGYFGTTTNTSISGNLRAFVSTDTYVWGVLLVKTTPKYERIAYLGGDWSYVLVD